MSHLKTVGVFRPASPNTRGSVKPQQFLRVLQNEAKELIRYGVATWQGRGKRAIVTTFPTNAILAYVGQMRYQDRPEVRGIDSKTHSSHGSTNPWKRVQHVRNDAYSDPIATRLNLQYMAGSHSGFTPKRVKQAVNATR